MTDKQLQDIQELTTFVKRLAELKTIELKSEWNAGETKYRIVYGNMTIVVPECVSKHQLKEVIEAANKSLNKELEMLFEFLRLRIADTLKEAFEQ